MDDIIETTNHFRCIDLIIDRTEEKFSESFIKELHRILKSGTSDSRKDWFTMGEYKLLPNELGGHETCLPEDVSKEMKALLKEYNAKTYAVVLMGNNHTCKSSVLRNRYEQLLRGIFTSL